MPSIAYVRTISDFRRFVAAAQRRALGYWPLLNFIAALVLACAIILNVERRCEACDAASMFLGATYVVGCIAGIQCTANWFMFKWYAKASGSILGPHALKLTDSGVEDTGPGYVCRNEWGGIEAIATAKDLLIIWVDTSAGIFIPRSAFATSDDEKAFIAYAEGRIAASRSVAAPPV